MNFLTKNSRLHNGKFWRVVVGNLAYLFIFLILIVAFTSLPGETNSNGANILSRPEDEQLQNISNNKDEVISENPVDEKELPAFEDQSLSGKSEINLNDTEKYSAATDAPVGKLKLHFIDVGQGDSILIQTPEQNILVDAGELNAGADVVRYIKEQGIESSDIVISTHPHSDHIGGLITVLNSISVKEVIDSAVAHTTKIYEDYLNIIDQKNIKFTEGRTGMARDLGGGAEMRILHPSSPSSDDIDNASIVTRITFGEISFLLSGDAGSVAESQILDRGNDLTSTVLKVSHHGSQTITTQKFLEAVKPKTAVIMCGKDNAYGHPHVETLAKLTAAGVDIYRTDEQGTIVITTDGKNHTANKQPFSFQQQSQPLPIINEVEPEPVATPVPKPSPESSQTPASIKVISITKTVKPGEKATVTIQGKANTLYSITVTYSSGLSKAMGLEAKISDPDGKVTWTWQVGTRTKEGTYPISINGDGENLKLEFTVKK